MSRVHEHSPVPAAKQADERRKNVLFREIPALSRYDALNPLRMPTTDLKAEQALWNALDRVNPEENGPTQKTKAKDTSVDVDPSMRGALKTIERLWRFSFQLSPTVTTAGFILGCFASLQGVATGSMIGAIQSSGNVSALAGLGLTALGISTAAALFTTSSLTNFNNERFNWLSSIFLAKKLDAALMAQEFPTLGTEQLEAKISEVKQHQMRVNMLLFGLSSGVAGVIGLTVSYVVMLQHYPILATAMLLATAPRFIVDYFLAPQVDEREREQAARLKRIESAGKLLSDSKSARELQMHQREDWGQTRREGLLHASRLGRFNIHRDIFWRQMFGSSTLIASGLLATAYPILDFFSKSLPADDLPAVVGAGLSLTTGAFLLSNFWGQVLSNRLFIQRVFNFFDSAATPATDLRPAAGNAMQDKGQPLYTFDKGSCIKFENITVTVPSVAEPILHFKELILTPGEVVGVVGERGQGKSTLLKLLMKQIQPSSGSISLCNVRDQTGAAVERVDVTNCETRDWHTMVSKLYQDYPDMEGLTVAQAVHLGTQTHETADFQRLQDIVKLKGGILREDAPVDATVIGGAEGGVNFSGGQRQGIAVLRTLLLGLKKPIMLLDEPGASSDPKNEHEMLHRIKQLGRDLSNPKVMIIVSHQYGTLTDADKIIVINNHTIEKIDTHHNLLSQKGTYFSAWQRQIESLVPGASVDIDPDGQPIFTSKRRSSDE